jgi:hypothetical protein
MSLRNAAEGLSSNPTTLTISGTDILSSEGSDDAGRHAIVGHGDGSDIRIPSELAAGPKHPLLPRGSRYHVEDGLLRDPRESSDAGFARTSERYCGTTDDFRPVCHWRPRAT